MLNITLTAYSPCSCCIVTLTTKWLYLKLFPYSAELFTPSSGIHLYDFTFILFMNMKETVNLHSRWGWTWKRYAYKQVSCILWGNSGKWYKIYASDFSHLGKGNWESLIEDCSLRMLIPWYFQTSGNPEAETFCSFGKKKKKNKTRHNDACNDGRKFSPL
jgi:hypothetical protein